MQGHFHEILRWDIPKIVPQTLNPADKYGQYETANQRWRKEAEESDGKMRKYKRAAGRQQGTMGGIMGGAEVEGDGAEIMVIIKKGQRRWKNSVIKYSIIR